MTPAEIPRFSQLLASVFDLYSRPAPQAATQAIWVRVLSEYPMGAIEAAMGRYAASEARFPPTPATIREYLGAGAGDGRPGADEAWAIAIVSRDESETVVWTDEIAQAFKVCSTVLQSGDEIGARMAFKDSYARLIAAARARSEPVRWVASIGFDPARREAALRQAQRVGLLPAASVAALLPPPDSPLPEAEQASARKNLAKIKAMIDGMVESKRMADANAAEQRIAHDRALKARAADIAASHGQRSDQARHYQ